MFFMGRPLGARIDSATSLNACGAVCGDGEAKSGATMTNAPLPLPRAGRVA